MAELALWLDFMIIYQTISSVLVHVDGRTTTTPTINITDQSVLSQVSANWELMFTALIVATAIFIVLLCTKRMSSCKKPCGESQATSGRGVGPAVTTEGPLVTVSAMINDLSPPKYEDCIVDKLPRYDELFDENGARRQPVNDKT